MKSSIIKKNQENKTRKTRKTRKTTALNQENQENHRTKPGKNKVSLELEIEQILAISGGQF
jgi:hypothetical protein